MSTWSMRTLGLALCLIAQSACTSTPSGSDDASGAWDASERDATAGDASAGDASEVRVPRAVEGLYVHAFTGSVDGTELATWGPGPTAASLEFSDLAAAGAYAATLAADGTFTFEGGVGGGAFVDDGTAAMDFAFRGGLHFHSEIHRAPRTDARFPVVFTSAVPGDPSLSGTWDAQIRELDPATGDALAELRAEVLVVVSGTTVRLTLPDGTYHQASWIAPDQAALRVVAPPPGRASHRTFPGCETSEGRDVLGDLRVLPDGSITMVLAFQTRAPLGEQAQTMQQLTLTRAP